MFTANDLADRYEVHVKTIYKWHRSRVLPSAINIGRTLRWREEDLAKWEEYLADRTAMKKEGLDPDLPEGPAPPVYSTGCEMMDPRRVTAERSETERRRRSQDLARKSKETEVQPVTYEED